MATDTNNPSREWNIQFQVPVDHPCFKDHFPGDSLVPGALLLSWFLKHLNAQDLQVRGIKQCKFMHVVRPGDHLQLKVIKQTGSTSLPFTCTTDSTLIAKGQFDLGSGALAHE